MLDREVPPSLYIILLPILNVGLQLAERRIFRACYLGYAALSKLRPYLLHAHKTNGVIFFEARKFAI